MEKFWGQMLAVSNFEKRKGQMLFISNLKNFEINVSVPESVF